MKTLVLTDLEVSIVGMALRDARRAAEEVLEDAVQWPEEFDEALLEDAQMTAHTLNEVLDKIAV